MSTRSIGSLRHRLVIEAPQRVDDGVGGAQISWAVVDSVWGSIEPKTGRETLTAGRLSGSVSHDISIRYRDDVKPTMRFVLGARRFEILAVLHPSDTKEWLKCLCSERDL